MRFALCGMIVLAAGCAATENHHKPQPVTPEMKQEIDAAKAEAGALDSGNALSPADFLARVTAAGGRADFVFGKDRPFAQCHASTVVETADGGLLCAWFGGTKEKDDDVGIWFSRFAGGAWSAPATAAKVEQSAHWNPVLFTAPDGATHLFFKVGPEIPHWRTYWMSTTDNGAAWTAPRELVAGDKGGRGPVKNKPILLSDGAWLAPASTEPGRWWSFADRSTDKGLTWTRSEDFAQPEGLKGKGAIQPTLWESEPGRVHALLRTSAGRVWRADSADFGKTWSPMRATGLPNNNSGIDALRLEDGRVLLLLNPVGKNWGPRTPLDLAVSKDNGETWSVLAHLENDPNPDSEYSYPAIVRTRGGVAACYTYNRDTVRCWQIPLAALGG